MTVKTKKLSNLERVIAMVEKEIAKKRGYISYMQRLKASYDNDPSQLANVVDFALYISELEEDLEDCKCLLAHIIEYAPDSAYEVFEGLVDE